MPKYATGLEGKVYVVTTRMMFGSTAETLVAAPNLAEAKSRYGYTRQQHTTRSVRRATWEDVERLGGLSRIRSKI